MNKKGFTLMEMLVVIMIIAVLVSILVPAVGNATEKAQAAADAANLRSAATTYQITEAEPAEGSYKSQRYPDAKLVIVSGDAVTAYYEFEGVRYGIDYFTAVANGDDTEGLAIPVPTESTDPT